jgi:poly(A) polymerase/tRNA nucleotidyltransferase (CCA-adding enzyme)
MTGPRRLSIEALGAAIRGALADLAALLGPAGQAWLVGGAVRQALVGEPVEELDVAVPSGAIVLGRALADRRGGGFAVLDEERGVCRVPGPPPVDLADFRGPTLEADLHGRDVTVNALAVSVVALVASGAAVVEDPTGGLEDLAARRLRLCSPRAMADDPVRVLRAVRLALRPGWRLGKEVPGAARAAAPALIDVSAERVRDEIAAILGDPGSARGLRMLDRLGAMAALFPESGPMREASQPEPHRFDVWEHSLRAVEAADAIVAHPGTLGPHAGAAAEHLAEEMGDGLTRAHLLKLAALLHDVAKPETRSVAEGRIRFIGHEVVGAARAGEVARRLRLSGRAVATVERLVRHHLRPMHLAQSGEITRRARYRLHRDLGADARGLVILALADAAAVRGEEPAAVWAGPGGSVLRALMGGMAEAEEQAATPPLLRGKDVMEAFGLGPGPTVGRLLARAREAQALGLVSSREEALGYLAGGAASAEDRAPQGLPEGLSGAEPPGRDRS